MGAAIMRASGPARRTTPMPPRPGGVAMATMVSSRFIGRQRSVDLDQVIVASLGVCRRSPRHLYLPFASSKLMQSGAKIFDAETYISTQPAQARLGEAGFPRVVFP